MSDGPPEPCEHPATRHAHDYLAPYREALAEHGPGFAATLWRSEDAQRVRFDALDALLPMRDRSVVDVGCGLGDLLVHLRERGHAPRAYVGLDAMPEMIGRARARGLRGASFAAADVLADDGALRSADADVACLSGTLNTMDDPTARRLIDVALAAVRIGVVFNFLSDRPHPRWHGGDLRPARRFDTADWVDWALSRSSRVRFDQSYLDGHDATIAILRE